MKEKILALLLAKFAGVRKDGLEQLAKALGLQATTEAEAQALVEKLDTEKVTEFVTDWRKEVDKEVTTGINTNEKKLKSKYDFVEKKPGDPKDPDPDHDPSKKDDISAKITAAVTAAVKPLQEQLNSIKSGKTNESRTVALETKLKEDKFKDVPEKTKAKILKDFSRMSFEKDEDFDNFLKETEEEMTGINQELADMGLNQQGKPILGQQNKDGVSKATQDYIDSKKNENNPLAGKELTTKK